MLVVPELEAEVKLLWELRDSRKVIFEISYALMTVFLCLGLVEKANSGSSRF